MARAWRRCSSKRQRRNGEREGAGLAVDAVGRKVRESEREEAEQAGLARGVGSVELGWPAQP